MSRRIGLFGGTFNPVHIGHLVVAQDILNKLKLEKMYFIPCGTPPHKVGSDMLEARHRQAMVKLAIKDNPGFTLSDVELKRKGKSYSIDTVRYFKEKYPESRIFFIIGADILPALHTWKDIDILINECEFVVMTRPEHDTIEKKVRNVGHFLNVRDVEVSSTEIRNLIRAGKSIHYMVPREVEKYIADEKLYKH